MQPQEGFSVYTVKQFQVLPSQIGKFAAVRSGSDI